MKHRLRGSMGTLALVALGAGLWLGGVNPAIAQTPSLTVWPAPSDPGLDGLSPLWQSVPGTVIPLTPQQVTPPMGGGTVRSIAVRGLHWDGRLYLMLEWADSTGDWSSDRPEVFTDAAAVQFPAVAGTAVPAICMGQADQAMNIWQWKADSQAGVPDTPGSGYVDLYPSTDDLYYTARAAGNVMAAGAPVQNLAAGGFGTLTALPDQAVEGRGNRESHRWAVVFSRPLDSPGDLQPSFGDTPTDAAFAVWDGSKGERDGIKSVSAFVRLRVTQERANLGGGVGGLSMEVALAWAIGLAIAVVVVAVAISALRSGDHD